MEPKITAIIPVQGFEIVLNRLGAILFLEIANQRTLGNDMEPIGFYLERTDSYDKDEGIVVNVSLVNTPYSGKTQTASQSDSVFNIDVYVNAKGSSVLSGDDAARQKLHKYVGWVRYILSCTYYKTLGFPPGGLGGAAVDDSSFDPLINRESGDHIRFSRTTYSARIMENQEAWAGVPLDGNDTKILINQTSKGYKLTLNNT